MNSSQMDQTKKLNWRDRLVFGVANLERGIGPALYIIVNEILPRAMHMALGKKFEIIRNVPYNYVDGQAIRLDIVKPAGTGPFPVILGIHGGAWMLGRKENIRHAGAYLARRGFMVLLMNYRLAPEHPWPACADDVRAAMRWAKANAATFGGDASSIGVFGDSAGGHLSAYAAACIAGEKKQNSDLPTVAAAVHWYGVFDFAKFARIPWRRTPQILQALFGADGQHNHQAWREASPRTYLDRAKKLPPTLLFAAGGDPLYSQSLMYARELKKRGVVVELKKYKNNIHGFLNLPLSPECKASLKHAARWFQAHLPDSAEERSRQTA